MNNFTKVFTAVKNRCLSHHAISGSEIQAIASETQLPVDRLNFYLECINDVGLIKYSHTDKKITLTDKGASTDKVFS